MTERKAHSLYVLQPTNPEVRKKKTKSRENLTAYENVHQLSTFLLCSQTPFVLFENITNDFR